MPQLNIRYIDAVKEYEKLVPKYAYDMKSELATDFFFRAFENITGQVYKRSDKIVDFGCGGGDTTAYLYENGYDVYGVDILEYWDKDAHLYGAIAPALSDAVRARLYVVDIHDNKLPFDDATISFIFSDQTLEHVFDYRPVFAEQARVLKPGGVAIHRFPHLLTGVEPHTRVPLTPLNRFRAYLAIWALLGWRNHRQIGMPWRAVVESNAGVFATTNYVSKKTILAATNGLGLDARFDDFLQISGGRAGRFYRAAARRGLGEHSEAHPRVPSGQPRACAAKVGASISPEQGVIVWQAGRHSKALQLSEAETPG